MTKSSSDFWHQVDIRIKENQSVIPSGFSPKFAKPLSAVGLHFWLIGIILSFTMAAWLWLFHYQSIMRIVRIIIWR